MAIVENNKIRDNFLLEENGANKTTGNLICELHNNIKRDSRTRCLSTWNIIPYAGAIVLLLRGVELQNS